MSEDKKPLTHIEFIQQELAKEDYAPSAAGIQKVLDGSDTHYEDGLIDIIMDLNNEYNQRSPIYPDGAEQG